MQLDFAILCDAAQVVGGKLYVLGGAIDRILTKQVPVVHPHMTLVMRFMLSPAEMDRAHKLEVVIMDGDGKKVCSFDGQLKVERKSSSDMWRPATPILTLNLVNAKFTQYGPHSIEVLVNGTSMKGLPLDITAPEGIPQPEAG